MLAHCDSYEHTYPPGSHRGLIRPCNQQPRDVVAVLEGLAKNHESTKSPGASVVEGLIHIRRPRRSRPLSAGCQQTGRHPSTGSDLRARSASSDTIWTAVTALSRGQAESRGVV